jgi:uncharacterized protein YcfL
MRYSSMAQGATPRTNNATKNNRQAIVDILYELFWFAI